ncbi:hypothetical protein [Variovorax sp. GT1P44]|uniref:hypothetical protein n=1 Tax=Variovorax sp. GT1P44 TaxID=3443742 RepID=UPI003F48C9CC
MIDHHTRGVLSAFPKDLAWDIFTLDCMLATIVAMALAALASLSDEISQRLADSEQWIWVTAATLGIVAVVCLLRLVLTDDEFSPVRGWDD